jgi:FKBP-type peptidyl-prolyl cis-trans isomerase FkpA
MRRFFFLLLLGLAGTLTAQTKGEQKTPGGFRYFNHTNKTGAKVQPGQTIKLSVDTYVGDSLLASLRRDYGSPRELELPTTEQMAGQPLPPIFDAIFMLAEGDSATVYQPIDSTIRGMLPESLQKENDIRFLVTVVDVLSPEEIAAAKAESEKEATAARARGEEVGKVVASTLADYNAGKLGKKLQKSASGLEYVVLEPGQANSIKEGDEVMTHYYGVLKANGEKFDSSFDQGQALPFPVGQLIPGFNEGMILLGHGGKGILFIPYSLAYGEAETGPIPAKSDLVFYIELK